MGGAIMAPPTMNPSAVSTGSGLSSPKLMTLFLSRIERSQRSHFLIFFWNFFENWTSKIFGGPRACREKSKKLKKIPFFCKKSYFFWLNLFCIRSQLSFEVYNSSVAQNLKFRPFLAWKFSFFSFVILRPVAQKVYHLGGCFWCLWTEKNQNIYLRPSFGLLVASKLRKLGGGAMAIMAPPCGYVIPDPMWNRVKLGVSNLHVITIFGV